MFESIKTKLKDWGQARRARDRVTFDDKGVTRTRGDDFVECVAWDDLVSVDIATTNEGPWFDDVFWLLSAGDHTCVVPSESEGMSELLLRLQELPGFDDETVIRAMGCTSNAVFPVWSREERKGQGDVDAEFLANGDTAASADLEEITVAYGGTRLPVDLLSHYLTRARTDLWYVAGIVPTCVAETVNTTQLGWPDDLILESRDQGRSWRALPWTKCFLRSALAFTAEWPPQLVTKLEYDNESSEIRIEFENCPVIDASETVYGARFSWKRGCWIVRRAA